MIKTIFRSYTFLILTISIYTLLVGPEYFLSTILFLFLGLYYLSILNVGLRKKDRNLSFSYFSTIYLLSTLIIGAVLNLWSFSLNQNFFVFSEIDALYYHETAEKLSRLPLESWFDNLSSFGHKTEDFGAILLTSIIYKIYPSNLLLNCFNTITGLITGLLLFKFGKKFLSIKYAFFGSLAFSISSFMIWQHMSGLKESFMVLLVVLFYELIDRFKVKRTLPLLYLILALIVSSFFFLYRPIIILFLLLSIIIPSVFNALKSKTNLYIFLSGFTLIFLNLNVFIYYFWYYTRGSFKEIFLYRILQIQDESMSPLFLWITNIISGIFGPFPNVNYDPISEGYYSAFFGPGLILKSLLSLMFILGVKQIVQTKNVRLYPITIFCLIQLCASIVVLRALDIRFSIYWFPFYYLIAAYYLNTINDNPLLIKRIKSHLNKSIYLIVIAILIWINR